MDGHPSRTEMGDPFCNLLSVLDNEVLDQVLSRLSGEEVARVGCTCQHLRDQISNGQHAQQLWLGHCKELLGELPVAHIAAACKADQASMWLRVYASARMADRLHWSPATPAVSGLSLSSTAACHSACSSSSSTGADPCRQWHVPTQSPDALLARTGHTATAVGTLLVLIGGELRDGPAAITADVAVLDLPGNRIIQPVLHGRQPPPLQHHCTARVCLQHGSALHEQVSAAVSQAQQSQQCAGEGGTLQPQQQQLQQLVCAGHTLLVFGGLQPDGCEQRADDEDQLHVLWLHPDATWGVWVHPSTTGPAPAPRAYACCAAIYDSTQLLVYGGLVNGSITGTVQSDVGEFGGYLLMCIYLLDPATLSWRRVPTRPLNEPPRSGHAMLGPSTCPGPRKQVLSCMRTNPATGKQEFMLLGGCGADGLADFVPYSLNLESFQWSKGPVMGYLPPARSACSAMLLTPSWLLLLGGQGTACREPLQNIQRLHLPTLSWRPPVPANSSSSSSGGATTSGGDAAGRGAAEGGAPTSSRLSNAAGQLVVSQQGASAGQTAGRTSDCGTDVSSAQCCPTVGCSAEACVVAGGRYEGPYGVSIMPRLQVLLPGPVIPPAQGHNNTAAASEDASGSATATSQPLMAVYSQGFAHKPPTARQHVALQQEQQEQAAWHAFTTCRCGSCCGCLTAKAAASSNACSGDASGAAAGPRGMSISCASDQLTQQQQQQQQIGPQGMFASDGVGSVPRWHTVGRQMPGDLARSQPGSAGAAAPGHGGSHGKQAPASAATQQPRKWEFEVEPATAAGAPQSCRAASLIDSPLRTVGLRAAQQGVCGGGWQASSEGGAAPSGTERVWQTPGGSNEGKAVQLLLALIVVVVGLLLMTPSLMMQQGSSS